MAIRPPSPLLSARRISVTYLSVTMMVSVQNIRGQDPVDVLASGQVSVRKDFLERVERARTDIAVDDADGTQGQGRQLATA